MASPGLVVLDYADVIADTTSDSLKLKIKEVCVQFSVVLLHSCVCELLDSVSYLLNLEPPGVRLRWPWNSCHPGHPALH